MLYITLVSPSLTFKCIDKLEDILLWKKTKKKVLKTNTYSNKLKLERVKNWTRWY